MISCCCTNYPSSSPNHPLPSLPSLLLSVSEKDMVGRCMERKSQGGNRRPYSHSDMLWRLINCHIIIINPGSAGTMAVKPMCVCVCVDQFSTSHICLQHPISCSLKYCIISAFHHIMQHLQSFST